MDPDRASLLRVLQLIGPRDVACCELASPHLAALARAPLIWERHLLQEFGLQLEGPGLSAIDMQTVYARVVGAGAPNALRFLAAYTDGGTDGGPDELHYWADHAFTPQHWSPYCSDGPRGVSVIGLLKAKPHAPDVARAAHRNYLIERSKWAATVLFAPPGARATDNPEPAARMLATWSMAGLERLYADLFQDLIIHQDSTWGKHLLRGVAAEERHNELRRLRDAFDRILARASLAAYRVECIDYELVQEAKAAAQQLAADVAKAQQAASGSMAQLQRSSSGPGSGTAAAGSRPATAAQAASTGPSAGPAAALSDQAASNAAPPWLAASMAPSLVAARHLVDAAVLPHMSSPAFGIEVAVVDEIVASRAGHFTCPALCGAVMLGQAPPVQESAACRDAASVRAGASASAAEHGFGSNVQQQQQQQQGAQQGPSQQGQGAAGGAQIEGPGWCEHIAVVRRLVSVPCDPLTAALNACTSADAVLAASQSGTLPPILGHHRLAGAEWIEFERLPADQLRARHARGWHVAPVVWFRFAPRSELPPEMVAAGQAALQVLGPGDEADELVIGEEGEGAQDDSDSDEGMAGLMETEEEDEFEQAFSTEESDGEWSIEEDLQIDAQDGEEGHGHEDEGQGEEAEEAAEDGGSSGRGEGVEEEYDSADERALNADNGEGGGAGSDADIMGFMGALGHQVMHQQHHHQQQAAQAVVQQQDQLHGPSQLPQQQQPQPQLPPPQMQLLPPPQQQQQQQPPEDQRLRSHAPHAAAAPDVVLSRSTAGRGNGSINAAHGSSSAGASGSGPSSGAQVHASSSRQGGRAPQSAHTPVDLAPGFAVAPPLSLGELPHQGPEALVLRMKLGQRRAGNMTVLKLINQENLMAQYNDMHDAPNIDIQYVALRGWAVTLPPGVQQL